MTSTGGATTATPPAPPANVPAPNNPALVVGWKLEGLHPEYWYSNGMPNPDARPGEQPQSALAEITGGRLQNHTAILAQSGAGKSVFLGRLLEEICLSSTARCLIFDPNGDFRRFHEVKPEELWSKAAYDAEDGGQLPHERDRSMFETQWTSLIKVRILGGPGRKNKPYEDLHISWPAVPVTALVADAPANINRLALSDCHTVVHHVARLESLKAVATVGQVDMGIIVKSALKVCATASTTQLKQDLTDLYTSKISVDPWKAREPKWAPFVEDTLRDSIPNILAAAARVANEKDARTFYFARLNQLQSAGIVQNYARWFLTPESPSVVDIVDLPSLRDLSLRRLAVSGLLAEELARAQRDWREALTLAEPETSDRRAPTFIVLDEAHHLAPAGVGLPESAVVLREQLRMIAGEGRKYGLFLILVTQRPDKVDDVVISECANVALMKHDSQEKLDSTIAQLRLTDIEGEDLDIMKTNRRRGVVLLTGPWARHADVDPMRKQSRVIYNAARRTVEGGRDLQWKLWCVRRPTPLTPGASSPAPAAAADKATPTPPGSSS